MRCSIPTLCCLLFLVTRAVSAADDQQLALTPAMVINETGLGDAERIVDEQELVGDPRTAAGARPESAYLTGWQDWMFPAHLILDLGPGQQATSLFLFNESGVHTIQVQSGSPAEWNAPQDVPLDRYREWHAVTFPVATRYLRLTLLAPTALPEVVAFGHRTAPAAEPQKTPAKRPPRPAFEVFLGTNSFIDDPLDQVVPIAGTMREYHNLGWDYENPDRQLRYQPSGAAGGNLWFFDDFYRNRHQAGVEVCPCVLQSLPWITGESEVDARPAPLGVDPADPAAYAAHAAHLFQFAARYGRTVHPDGDLTLAPGQPRISGLGTLRFFENANEPDKDWKGRASMSSPFEFAAQCSADYDGHRGALGPGHGVRTADPQARVVMGGLYRKPLVYLDAMKFWSDHYRGGSFPADVINVHHYCGDGDAQQAFKTRGISPEAGELRRRMQDVVAWRDRHVPDAEVWVTEFGYDTHPGSPLHAPALGGLSGETVQAAWLARSFFALAAAGVDRALMFMFRDVDEASGQVFATSGLVTSKGKWERKPSWYFQAALKKHLAGLHWAGDVPAGRDDVAIMQFTGDGRTVLALWCTTSEDRKVPGYRLKVPGARAQLIELADERPEGRLRELQVVEGEVTVDLSEVPILVKVE